MSGRGGVGFRERLRLASYPAGPASLAGCRCQAPGPGLVHLAGAPSRPEPAGGQPSWGGARSPVAPALLSVVSIPPPAASARSPQGLGAAASLRGRAEPRGCCCCGRRRPPLSERDPPREPGGEGAGIGGDTPSEARGGFCSRTLGAVGVTARAISFPSPRSPWVSSLLL